MTHCRSTARRGHCWGCAATSSTMFLQSKGAVVENSIIKQCIKRTATLPLPSQWHGKTKSYPMRCGAQAPRNIQVRNYEKLHGRTTRPLHLRHGGRLQLHGRSRRRLSGFPEPCTLGRGSCQRPACTTVAHSPGSLLQPPGEDAADAALRMRWLALHHGQPPNGAVHQQHRVHCQCLAPAGSRTCIQAK